MGRILNVELQLGVRTFAVREAWHAKDLVDGHGGKVVGGHVRGVDGQRRG